MFATQTNKKAKPVAERKPHRADAATGKDSPEPNPIWQSLALNPYSIQPKLAISQPDDPFEREADHIADRVMWMPTPPLSYKQTSLTSSPLEAQRKCAPCEEEEEEETKLQLKEANQRPAGIQMKSLEVSSPSDEDEIEADEVAPRIINGSSVEIRGTRGSVRRRGDGSLATTSEFQSQLEGSKGSGQPLPADVQDSLGSKMGTDLRNVKTHTGSIAHEMSESIGARAFTLGSDVYFNDGEYNPDSKRGKELLVHELAHTVQQQGKAQRKIQRAVLYPVEPKQARIEAVSMKGGLMDDAEIRRASAIVDSATTIRSIANLILPWFNAALLSAETKAPRPVSTTDELARALVVFNQEYIPVTDKAETSMTNFKVGFRLPLPVVIQTNDEWIVNPYAVRNMAAIFNEAWAPYLDQRPKAASVPTDMAAETDKFMRDNPSALERAFHLYAMILTNPTEALPFLRALFKRTDVGYELAIELVNNMVNHQVGMLASLEQGYEIVGILYNAVNAAPHDLPKEMIENAARAIKMLGQFAVPAITAVPSSLSARGIGGVEYSTITITGLAPNSTAVPTVRAVPYSGGHDHDNNRPTGTLSPVSAKTERTGRAEFRYRSNTPGGEEIVSIDVGGHVLEVHIDIEVPDLVELPAGGDYDLTGNTAQHNSPHNHFGTPATIQALQDIAAEYETYKQDHNLPNWPRIGYNDISLPRGGIFDINGNWVPSHVEHRLGTSVDFRLNYSAAQRAVLRDIITRHGATILDEGNHWHLRF